MEKVLYESPWIPYTDHFIRSNFVLSWPKNVVFIAQFLDRHLSNPVYQKYPFAEKFDISLLDTIDWTDTHIVLDKYLNVVIAPEPVKRLVNLDKRLRHQDAARVVFNSFFSSLQIFQFKWVVFWVAVAVFSSHLFRNKSLRRYFRS